MVLPHPQVHAHACDAPVFLIRPESALRDASPAPLRLSVSLGQGWDIDVQIRKRRDGTAVHQLYFATGPGWVT